MSYEFYKIIHILGLLMAISGLTGLFMAGYNSGEVKNSVRKLCAITHGLGLALLLISGFGLSARLGYTSGFPTWIYGKLAIWLSVGAAMIAAKRFAKLGPVIYFLILGLGVAGATLAIVKP